MNLVILFVVIAFLLVVLQVIFVLYAYKKANNNKGKIQYSKDNIKNCNLILNALLKCIIKKHIITNSANGDDSYKVVNHYDDILKSNMMTKIMSRDMDQEFYYG